MNLAALLTEFYAQGFDYLNDGGAGATRATNWINSAYQELCVDSLWPFLDATSTGSGTVTIADLRRVESVVDSATNRTLIPIDRRTLTESYGTLTTSGSPVWFYVSGGTTVKTYPVGGSLTVQYFKAPADLTGTDTPIVPAAYHDLIVLGAVRRALQDDQDAQDYQQVNAEYGVRLAAMRKALLLKPEQQALVADHVDG